MGYYNMDRAYDIQYIYIVLQECCTRGWYLSEIRPIKQFQFQAAYVPEGWVASLNHVSKIGIY